MRRRADYHYDLPPEHIAHAPAQRRDSSRLMVVEDQHIRDHTFADIVELIPQHAVLAINDTQVFPARLRTHKPTGGAVELLFLRQISVASDGTETWRCMARSSKPLRPGQVLSTDSSPQTRVTIASGRAADATIEVQLHPGAHGDVYRLLDQLGEVPLPPYIPRADGPSPGDRDRYQTVYARERGAVAAPTAGLHFTPAILDRLRDRGVAIAPITLHVGMGTFAPVRVEVIDDHQMHAEHYAISIESAQIIERARSHGRPIVAVGTTCVRALESAARAGPIRPGAAVTDLFITPGYSFAVVDRLITNFHLPESTLLMLVCAFAGHQRIMNAYRCAISRGYRFFSYGDAMLIRKNS